MIRIRKFINKPSKWPFVGIVLVMALAVVLGAGTASAVGPRPCPNAADPPASDAINVTNIVTKFASAMGNDTYPADLNIWNPQPLPGDSGGALWDYFPSDQASGTGVFNTYLAVQSAGGNVDEQGFNTGGTCHNFQEGDSKTSALPLNKVPIVDINGTLYREFACDINEVSGIPKQYISLEVLQIWQTNSTDLCGTYAMSPDYKFTPAQRLVYDLDCAKDYTLVLDYGVNTGSGKPDYKVFVPASWFDQTLTHVVMVVDHGNIAVGQGKDDPYYYYGDSDGFEEWGVRIIDCCLNIVKGSIGACYPDVATAEAAAIAATNVTDTCSGVVVSVSASTAGTCNAVITVTGTDFCGNSLSVTYNTQIASPINLNVPGNFTATACTYANQAAANAAFNAWVASANFTGGCNGVLTNNAGAVPAFCGGSATVTWNVTSACENVTKSRTFTITAAPAVVVNYPANNTTSACDYVDQAAVNAVFNTWLTGFTATGGCDPQKSTEGATAPDKCGGTATVHFIVTDKCYTTSNVTRTFTITAAPAVVLNVPGNFTAPTCYGNQTVVDEAFDAWVASANVTGGCNANLTNNAGSAPSRCGGNVTVTWNVTSSCENVTKSATFTIPAGCCVSCGTAVAAQGPVDPGQYLFGGAQNNWFTYVVYNKTAGHNSPATAQQYPIFTGQTHRVGTLYVYNNSTRLFVQYCVDAGLGVGITSYHLEVVDEFNGFNRIRTRNHGVYGNPIPGQCEYKDSVSGMPACSGWIVSVNDDISKYGDNDIYIFAHSIMCWPQAQ